METTTKETVELLQQLIRNACVNDGTQASGQEARSTDVLESYLEGAGADMQRYESVPGRDNLVARIEGSDPKAPSLILMGHTDVVPVNPDRWRRDPFGGEVVDGELWGRGAIDMLNLTSSMAVAFRSLAAEGFRPRGTLIYLAVADEESLGTYGAKWMVENEPDAVRADYLLTEEGGTRFPLGAESGPKLPVMVGEKGAYWCRLTVRGTPGHGSIPFRTDNALVKAAEVVRRLAEYEPATNVHDVWRRFVESLDLPRDISEQLLDPSRVLEFASSIDDLGLARILHASTHTTIAPTILHGGVKTNIIPDTVQLDVDVRTLPGQSEQDIRAMIAEAIGDLAPEVEVEATGVDLASESPMETPLWDSLQRVTEALVPGSKMVPFMQVGATDARFFRRIGTTAYGYGLFSERISFGEFMSMFHGDDERVDIESLELTTGLWDAVVRDLLG